MSTIAWNDIPAESDVVSYETMELSPTFANETFAELPFSTRQFLATYKKDYVWDPDDTYADLFYHLPRTADRAAWLRRKHKFVCPRCESGQANATESSQFWLEDGTEMLLVDIPRSKSNDRRLFHGACAVRKHYDVAKLAQAGLPSRFRNVALNQLKPWARSPIPVAEQAAAIDRIPADLPGTLHGWLMLGPAGTSKTTFACAAIKDWLTFRLCHGSIPYNEDNPGHLQTYIDDGDWRWNERPIRTNFYAVSVPYWLDEMMQWETRDFDDKTVKKPSLDLSDIGYVYGQRPILLLEEVDKFVPTDTRRNMLFRLVDAFYKIGGMIVTTANTPLPELKKTVGEPVFRRLAGTNDEPEAYMVWDLFGACKQKKAGKVA